MDTCLESEMLRGTQDVNIGKRESGPGKLMAQLRRISRHVMKASQDEEAEEAGISLVGRGAWLLVTVRHDDFPGLSQRYPVS